MVSGASATYAYNSQGLRTSKTVGNETDYFVLVSGNVWNDGTTDYLRGIELISNGTNLYLYNIRGDVIQLVDYSGSVVKTYDYDAYGNELTRDLNDENPFRYCGEYYDTETGFIYLRARYYDPLTGRFAAMDTHWNPNNAIYGDNPVKTSRAEDCESFYPNLQAINQSTNLYVYCGNNAINRIDHTGGFWQELWEYYVQLLQQSSAYFAVAGTVSQLDTVAPGPADLASLALLAAGALVIGGIAVLQYTTASISITITDVQVKEKDIAIPDIPDNQAYFTVNPYDFLPRGLIRNEYEGSGNGRIIKWSDPSTKLVIFEWDEDLEYGAHYHALMPEWGGKHLGPHYIPGSPVPEPWNSIYF